jgi:hypothetical protein
LIFVEQAAESVAAVEPIERGDFAHVSFLDAVVGASGGRWPQ